MFAKLDGDRDGVVQGADCFALFSSSGLSKPQLKLIWDVVAGNVGQIHFQQFFTILYLIQGCLSGKPVPVTLPPPPFPPLQGAPPAADTPSGATGPLGAAGAGMGGMGGMGASPAYMQPGAPAPNFVQQVGALPELAPQGGTGAAPAPAAAFTSLVPSLDQAKASSLDPAQQHRLEEHRARAAEREREKQQLEASMRANQEKERFYQDTMKELVMFKSRVDASLVELQSRAEREEAGLKQIRAAYEEKHALAAEAREALVSQQGSLEGLLKEKEDLQERVAELTGQDPGALAAELGRKLQAEQVEVDALRAQAEAAEAQQAVAQEEAAEARRGLESTRALLERRVQDARAVIAAAAGGSPAEVALKGLEAEVARLESDASGGRGALRDLLERAAEVYVAVNERACVAGVGRVGLPGGGSDRGAPLQWQGNTAREAKDWDFDFKDEGFTVVHVLKSAGEAPPASRGGAPPPADLTPPAPSGGADAAAGGAAGFDLAGLQISGASGVNNTNSAPPSAREAPPAPVPVSLEANGLSDASPALVGAAAGGDNGPKGAAAPAAVSGVVEAPPLVGVPAPPPQPAGLGFEAASGAAAADGEMVAFGEAETFGEAPAFGEAAAFGETGAFGEAATFGEVNNSGGGQPLSEPALAPAPTPAAGMEFASFGEPEAFAPAGVQPPGAGAGDPPSSSAPGSTPGSTAGSAFGGSGSGSAFGGSGSGSAFGFDENF